MQSLNVIQLNWLYHYPFWLGKLTIYNRKTRERKSRNPAYWCFRSSPADDAGLGGHPRDAGQGGDGAGPADPDWPSRHAGCKRDSSEYLLLSTVIQHSSFSNFNIFLILLCWEKSLESFYSDWVPPSQANNSFVVELSFLLFHPGLRWSLSWNFLKTKSHLLSHTLSAFLFLL